jgi:hypothetical protein
VLELFELRGIEPLADIVAFFAATDADNSDGAAVRVVRARGAALGVGSAYIEWARWVDRERSGGEEGTEKE